jgi:hypothetical protein
MRKLLKQFFHDRCVAVPDLLGVEWRYIDRYLSSGPGLGNDHLSQARVSFHPGRPELDDFRRTSCSNFGLHVRGSAHRYDHGRRRSKRDGSANTSESSISATRAVEMYLFSFVGVGRFGEMGQKELADTARLE